MSIKSKPQTTFLCNHCDTQYTKWTGRCLECGKWGTIGEVVKEQVTRNKEQGISSYKPAETVELTSLKGKDVERTTTTTKELDRVLGGGVVPGSLILLGGEPGIGKSTLALQLAMRIPNTLYFSAEESVEQVKLRADRLFSNEQNNNSVTKQHSNNLRLANESNVETILATIKHLSPTLIIVDSIQTIFSHDADGEAGNITQVRACTTKLLEAAKESKTAIILIGHVTKEGFVAGPKTLEHLVDTVLYLEGDRYHTYRILRTIKNRFGSTDEVGIFEMMSDGLHEVKNPSASFLEERGDAESGTVVTCLMEGTRPLLVEVQALVNKTSFGYPVRKASGFDLNRLHVLVAVLQKRAKLDLGQYDIHVNIAGGVKANEPAADLAVCLAIASSFKDKVLGKDLVAFGEVGLGGEIRRVSQTDRRLKECEALALKRAIIPASAKNTTSKTTLKLFPVKNIEELIKHS